MGYSPSCSAPRLRDRAKYNSITAHGDKVRVIKNKIDIFQDMYLNMLLNMLLYMSHVHEAKEPLKE